MTYTVRFRLGFAALTLAAPLFAASPASAVAPDECKAAVCWEIANRFRLFADQTDFQDHVDAWRATEKDGHSVLAMERWLHTQKPFEKRGWAENVFQRKSGLGVCFDETKNRVLDPCKRDAASERYFQPDHYLVRLHVNPPADFAEAECEWIADRGFVDSYGHATVAPSGCKDQSGKYVEARVRKGVTKVRLILHKPDATTWSKETIIEPRTAIVAGMGDSFTSGDGNPDVPVRLRSVGHLGMCFYRVFDGGLFWLPSREIDSDRDCYNKTPNPTTIVDAKWTAARAKWLHAPCHRSLYGHQLRAAIALAIEDVHRAIAYVPMGCTGAEIKAGLLGPQNAREFTLRDNSNASASVPAQVPSLRRQLKGARPDLVFLTVGGNDVGFSQLAANIIIHDSKERGLVEGAKMLFGPGTAKAKLKSLGDDFAALRRDMRDIVRNDFRKVVYTPYGNPLTHGDNKDLCGQTRRGFDAHPALGFDKARADATSKFVEDALIPTLKNLATCARPGDCATPEKEGMRWADLHRDAFAAHGVCARFGAADAPLSEPSFDEACLRDGHTFHQVGDAGNGLAQPFRACGQVPAAWRPYASRGRWTRTANDSYLTAMTYADSLPRVLHGYYVTDAIWGMSSVLFGGAAHPTAEGHAAMADAALVEARKVLSGAP